MVSWFTNGGCRDECGVWHHSGHNYKWSVLSVLNEVQHEHFTQGCSTVDDCPAAAAYTACFDQIKAESLKVYPGLTFVGPVPLHGRSLHVYRFTRRCSTGGAHMEDATRGLLHGEWGSQIFFILMYSYA